MHCWPRYLLIAVVSVLGVGEMIAACGQKGALYLPKAETGKAQPNAPAEATEGSTKKGKVLEHSSETTAQDRP
jgi:predicted small lipoprotein YifL